MPQHARGAHYFGKVAKQMKCRVDHNIVADAILGELNRQNATFRKMVCEGCGSTIIVNRRGVEFEQRIFPGKER